MILVVDIGTSACKAYLFKPNAEIFFQKKENYSHQRPYNEWVELDPEMIWDKVCSIIKSILLEKKFEEIIGISITAQLGIVPVDGEGNALGPILTWMDKRAKKQAESLLKIYKEKDVYSFSGRKIDPELSGLKMLWYKENLIGKYHKTYKFLSLKDYIINKFTGKFGTDPTHASYTILYNVNNRKWETDFIKDIGLDEKKLPDVFESNTLIGTVDKNASVDTGLKIGIPVVIGGPDGTIGTLGAGLNKEGLAVNVVGTTDVFFTCTNEPVLDKKMLTITNCHLVPGMWVLGGPMGMTGGCLDWFLGEFGLMEAEVAKKINRSAFYLFDKEVVNIKENIGKLFFFTGLTGNRTPHWDPDFRGSILGLSPYHKKEHIIQAILEGSSFITKELIDITEGLGINIKEVRMIGGGARSIVWPQIKANVTGKEYVVPENVDATALGAFMAVAVGIGIFKDFSEANEKVFKVKKTAKPNLDKYLYYQEKYKKFNKIYNLLEQIYQIF